jgi:hypothetical protein
MLSFWPGWKWLLKFTKACDGKFSASYLKQSWNNGKFRVVFSSKQLWLQCSFSKTSVECSEQLELAWGLSGLMCGWQFSTQGSWSTREESNSCQLGSQNASAPKSYLKEKNNSKRGVYNESLSLTLTVPSQCLSPALVLPGRCESFWSVSKGQTTIPQTGESDRHIQISQHRLWWEPVLG